MAKSRDNSTLSTCWTFEIYKDSAPSDWLSILRSFHIPMLVSPYHDKDVTADGSPKKPHFHVLVDFGTVLKSREQLLEISDCVNGVVAPWIGNMCKSKVKYKRSMVRYFTHMDDADKYQYDYRDCISIAGFPYDDIVQMPSSKYKTIEEMIDFIENQNITSYRDLLVYARKNNYTWFIALCDNSTYVIKEFLKSKGWQQEKQTLEDLAEYKKELLGKTAGKNEKK